MSRSMLMGFVAAIALAGCNEPASGPTPHEGLYYQIYACSGGEYCWRLRAGNNKIIASGESYKNLQDCQNAVDLLKRSFNAPVYDLSPSPADQ